MGKGVTSDSAMDDDLDHTMAGNELMLQSSSLLLIFMLPLGCGYMEVNRRKIPTSPGVLKLPISGASLSRASCSAGVVPSTHFASSVWVSGNARYSLTGINIRSRVCQSRGKGTYRKSVLLLWISDACLSRSSSENTKD